MVYNYMHCNGISVLVIAAIIFRGREAGANDQQETLSGWNGEITYNDTTDATWRWTNEVNETFGIFLRLQINRPSNCNKFKLFGIWRVNSCEWQPELCLFLVAENTSCGSLDYGHRFQSCPEFSLLIITNSSELKLIPKKSKSNYFQFSYKYVSCNLSEASTTQKYVHTNTYTAADTLWSQTTAVKAETKMHTTAANAISDEQKKCDSNTDTLVIILCVLGAVSLALIVVSALACRRLHYYKAKFHALLRKEGEERKSGRLAQQQSSTAEIVVNEIYEGRYDFAQESN